MSIDIFSELFVPIRNHVAFQPASNRACTRAGVMANPSYNSPAMDTFRISTDPQEIDIAAVHAYLSRSYWATNIPYETVARSVANSLCFAVFDNQRQVGFARVVTDRATFAYLCDVYVLEEYRGRGLGKRVMESVCAHPDLQGVPRFALDTRDAHGLYEKFGFKPPQRPNAHMEILRPGIYPQTGL